MPWSLKLVKPPPRWQRASTLRAMTKPVAMVATSSSLELYLPLVSCLVKNCEEICDEVLAFFLHEFWLMLLVTTF
jgi:hypothetical protein